MWKLLPLIGLLHLGGAQDDYYNHGECCDAYCYRQDQTPYVFFGTKTAYHFAYGKSSNQHIVPRCEPVQFWSLNRHGARYPTIDQLDRLKGLTILKEEILKNYEQRQSYPQRGRMCEDDLDLFRRWKWNYTLTNENANQLAPQGGDDVRFLARRYQTRFSKLLGPNYSEQDYTFRYTDTPRTHDSYKAYIDGLFGDRAYQVHAETMHNDQLLKAYKECPAWYNEVKNNPEANSELTKWTESKQFEDLVREVSRRLGFRYNLNASQIQDMYDMCRYEKAWMVQRYSAWCSAFNGNQLKLLEYGEDLKYYYQAGYGHELNKRLGCPPLKDMYERFEKIVQGDKGQPKAVVYFTHTSSLQLLLTAMGIAKDNTPLMSDNYDRQERRQWRTSLITPFAANLAAIMYKCQDYPENRVMFFLNEKPVEYEGCAVGLCPWETLKNKLKDAAENCNLDFCTRNSAPTLSVMHSQLTALILSIFTTITVFLH